MSPGTGDARAAVSSCRRFPGRWQVGEAARWKGCHHTRHALSPGTEAPTSGRSERHNSESLFLNFGMPVTTWPVPGLCL